MAVLPKPGSSATNPVDAANPGVPPEILKEVLLKSGEEKMIDLQILIQLFYIYKFIIREGEMTLDEATPYRGLVKAIEEVHDQTDKPVVLVLPNSRRELEDLDLEEVRRRACRVFFEKGILTFENLTDAFRAIAQVSRYYARREAGNGLKKWCLGHWNTGVLE